MTTAELRKRIEKIEKDGCPKKEVLDYRQDDLEKDINAIGLIVSEDRKITADAVVGINSRIDNMKNLVIAQLAGLVIALAILIVNMLRGH